MQGVARETGDEPVQRSAKKLSEAEHLARLQADVDAVLTLQLSNFADAAWEPLANALVEYGFAVLRNWIATGQIFRELARGRGPIGLAPPPDGWLDQAEAESIAGEVVTRALIAFKDDVLAKGVWNAARGASLSTFFVGQCKLQFPNVYRRWLREGQRCRLGVDAVGGELGLDHHPAGPGSDPAQVLAEEDRLASLLGRMSPRTARVMYRKFVLGMSYDEIAFLLDDIKDAKAAENLVAKERAKWKTGKRAS